MNWLQTTVGNVCSKTAQIDPRCNGAESFRYVDISSIDRERKIISRAESIPCADAPSRARKLVQVGDVLVSTVRPNLNAVAIVPEELDGGIASTGFAVLRARAELAIPRYLFFRAQSREFIEFLVTNATGASYPAVTDRVVRSAPLSLPSPSEQARIVDFLDEADRLRSLRYDADTKTARVLPALFLKMFGDPATNPMNWEMTTVGDVISSTDYGTSTKASNDGSGFPLIRMSNVDFEGNLDLSDLKHVQLSDSDAIRFRLESGDILFNRTNSKELVGKTGLWEADIDAVLASYFIRVRVDREKVIPTFFWAFMNSAYMKRVLRSTARGAIGQANINATELRAFPIYRPSLEQQHVFSRRLKMLRETLPHRGRGQNDLDRLFSLMLVRALSGQLTCKWRDAHMQDLLSDMEQQAQLLGLPPPGALEVAR